MSEIKFSNLIFEQQKEAFAQATNPSFESYNTKLKTPGTNLNRLTEYANLDPKLDYSQQLLVNEQVQQKKLDHYISKVNIPGTNLISLELSIDSEPNLSDTEKNNLYRMIADKRKDPSKTLDYKLYSTYFPRVVSTDPNAPLSYYNNYSGDGSAGPNASGSGGTSGLGSTSDQTVFMDTDSGVELDPSTLSKLKLESLYSGGIEKDPNIKTRGMKPSTESIGMEQTQTLASLEAQYNETKKKINLLDKLYAQIVRNPTNLNLGTLLNAHTGAQFVKLAEKDIIEADEVTEEYYDDLLPGFGTALEHPEKYRNIPTDEIKPHKAPKFIKVK
jgi:hypothetical protein